MSLVLPLLLITLAQPTPPAQIDVPAAQRLVALLQYLEGDYGAAVASGDKSELTEQAGFAAEAIEAAQSLGPAGEPYLSRLTQVQRRIDAGTDPDAVAHECRAIAEEVARLAQLQRKPRRTPDLEHARALWATNCAACHGDKGDGQSPLAATMKPLPASFFDEERMATMTPYKSYNTTAFGVTGTPMPAFPYFTEDERWDLGFFVFTFRQPTCDGHRTTASLSELATSTDAALVKKYGEKELACLRQQLPDADEGQALATTKHGIEKAVVLYRAGDHLAARRAVVDAYLTGLEPIEPMLRTRNPERVARLERAFTAARLATQGEGDFEHAISQLLVLLDEHDASARGDFWSVLIATALILLREGFEAMVVVGALLAVLKKMGATAQARVVHLGWITALIAGAAGFALGHQLLSGAHREWLETLVSFAAVAMLLYAALWLNARVNTSRFMGEIRSQMKEALGGGSRLGLFAIAFSAVGRETFETALFLQGLAGDSFHGVLAGSAVGLIALAGMVVTVSRVGFRLPMKTLFSVSTVVLVVTAIALLGQGVHGLQELGVVPLAPLRFVEIAPLGLFPDAWSLVAQALLAALPLTWWLIKRGKTPRNARVAPPRPST